MNCTLRPFHQVVMRSSQIARRYRLMEPQGALKKGSYFDTFRNMDDLMRAGSTLGWLAGRVQGSRFAGLDDHLRRQQAVGGSNTLM